MAYKRWHYLGLLAMMPLAAVPAWGQSRYVTDGGVTYRETVRRVVQPSYETNYVGAPPAYAVQGEGVQTIQTEWVPVTTYRLRTTWSRPRLFGPSIRHQQCVPVTQWRPQTRSVTVPQAVQAFSPPGSSPVVQPNFVSAQPVPAQGVRYVERNVVTRTPVGPGSWFAGRSLTAGRSSSNPPTTWQPGWRLGRVFNQGWAWSRPSVSTVDYPVNTPSLATTPVYVTRVPAHAVTPAAYNQPAPTMTVLNSTPSASHWLQAPNVPVVNTLNTGTLGASAATPTVNISSQSSAPPRTASRFDWRPSNYTLVR